MSELRSKFQESLSRLVQETYQAQSKLVKLDIIFHSE